MTHPARLLVYTALVASMAGVASTGHAQSLANESDTQDLKTDDTLQDIVVTAQKRSESMQKVPISVVATSGQQLANAGITSITQIVSVAPGTNVRVTQGSFQPFIRGIGTSSSVVENPVALYIDGIYYPQQREGLRDLLDVEQLAVLKGPQGTLFGRNATGGVIQITTRRPSHTFSAEGTVSYDTYETLLANGYVTGGLGDMAAFSLSGQFSTQGRGWGRDRSTGSPTGKLRYNGSIRAKLLLEPGSRTDITLIGDFTQRAQYAEAFRPYPGTTLAYPGLCVLKSKYDSCGGIDGKVAFHGGGGSLTIEHDLDFARLVSISSYRKGNASFQFDNGLISPTVFAVISPDNPNEDYTEELQIISNKASKFTWVVGAFYFHNKNGNLPAIRYLPLALPGLPPFIQNNAYATEIAESVAGFGEAGYEILPGLKATFGTRFTHEKRTQDAYTDVISRAGVRTITNFPDQISINKFTYRAVLNYDFTPSILGYVSYNTGFKSGGFNVLGPNNPAYLPEKLRAWEGGIKSQLFRNKLRLNLSAFHYDYTNVQVTQVVNASQLIRNGARAELYGLDIDMEAQLARGLRLSGGAEFLHPEFTDYPGAVLGIPKPNFAGAVISSFNAAGKRLPLAQRFAGNLQLDYDQRVSFGKLHYNVSVAYNGNYYFEPDNFLKQGAYTTLNTSLKWEGHGGFSVTLWGRNLFNEIVIERTSSQGQGYPTIYGFPPRTVGVTVGYKM